MFAKLYMNDTLDSYIILDPAKFVLFKFGKTRK